MPVHILVENQSKDIRIAVNGKINCSHDNYTVETDEYVRHPDDPRGDTTTEYAVCEECGQQGRILKDGTVVWEES
jgi:hypothetical protein